MAYKKSLAARVKRVEAKVAAQRPETKVYTAVDFVAGGSIAAGGIDFFELGDIVEGTGFNERVGNKIRVHKVEVRGSAGVMVGVGLLKSKLAVDPAGADFEGSKIPFLKGDQLGNTYVPLYEHTAKNEATSLITMVKFSRSWKAGIPVSYEDPTTGSCSHNNLYVYGVNLQALPASCQLSVRVWYTDA